MTCVWKGCCCDHDDVVAGGERRSSDNFNMRYREIVRHMNRVLGVGVIALRDPTWSLRTLGTRRAGRASRPSRPNRASRAGRTLRSLLADVVPANHLFFTQTRPGRCCHANRPGSIVHAGIVGGRGRRSLHHRSKGEREKDSSDDEIQVTKTLAFVDESCQGVCVNRWFMVKPTFHQVCQRKRL